jgi:hypothetical protein
MLLAVWGEGVFLAFETSRPQSRVETGSQQATLEAWLIFCADKAPTVLFKTTRLTDFDRNESTLPAIQNPSRAPAAAEL